MASQVNFDAISFSAFAAAKGARFPVFAKCDVNGPRALPLYAYPKV